MPEPPSLDQLLARLRDSEWRTRWRAAQDLGELRDKRAFDSLVEALADPRIEVRLAATAALVRVDAERAFDHLLDQLEHHDNYAAATALGWHGDRRATGPLVAKLSEVLSRGRSRTPEDVAMCMRGADSLGRLNDPAAVEVLVRLGQDHDSSLRREAARALGDIGDPRALESLMALLADSDIRVRSDAVRALGKLGRPEAVEPLIRILREETGDMACAAAEALGDIGDARALEPLVDHVHTISDSTSRWFAAVALGKLRDPRALEQLLRALRDQAVEVRCGAAEGLGLLGDARALPDLETAALRDEGEWELGNVRDCAQQAIERIRS